MLASAPFSPAVDGLVTMVVVGIFLFRPGPARLVEAVSCFCIIHDLEHHILSPALHLRIIAGAYV
jgi:hypothetical protein